MKQRHVQNFLMVSAAFFAISAPVGARTNSSSFGGSSMQPTTHVRVQSVQAGAEQRRESEDSDDDNAA
jgi:hypothetical protein